jgi:GTPase
MREKVFLLIILRKEKGGRSAGDISEEMRELIYSSNGNVVDSLIATIDRPTPNYFLRKGKLDEVAAVVKKMNLTTVVTNIDLSPIQSRNLEEYLAVKVIDRTGLILDIFAQRAKSRAGKLQVELAQYTYLLPRLSTLWEKFSRLGGGIGTRGPGEQILERDRRKIRKHITRLKKELKKVKVHRDLIRSSRKKKEAVIVSIVGYTNAGKSTLLKTLTGADILVQDKLFATLDPVTRRFILPDKRTILLTDTVGFLFDLPHGLIDAFHSTLEEINQADLIIVVLDGSNREYDMHYAVVQKTLGEIDAEGIPQLVVCNKSDMLDAQGQRNFILKYPAGIVVSARHAAGLDILIKRINEKVSSDEDKNNIPEKDDRQGC